MKHNLMPLNLQFFAEGEETSVNNEEVADLQDTTVEETVDTSEGETPEEVTEGTAETDAQSAEDNARYAAARRRAEMEFNRRQAEEDAEYERRFGNYANPITGQPIRSKRDYFDALDAQETLKRNAELQEKGIDPRVFEEMVSRQVANNPMVVQAQQVMSMTQNAYFANETANAVKEISQINPDIKTVDDLVALPNFMTEIVPLVNAGVSITNAYKVTNLDALMKQNSAVTKQATINNIKGTQHLNVTDGVNASTDTLVDIPTNELAQWKRAFPDCSMKELKKKYNNSL